MTRGRWRQAAGLALLGVANQTHPGDVYVTATARRVLCPDLPDADSRPTPG